MRTVTVEVTDEDIAEGKRLGIYTHPVTRALQRALPGTDAQCAGDDILLTIDEEREYFDTPLAAFSFLCNFDTGNPVSPFAFDLEIPD